MLFTFPSRYWFTIGRRGVLRLGGWSPQLPAGFLVSRGTQDTGPIEVNFVYGAITLCGWPFQCHFTISSIFMPVLQPHCNRSHNGLGCSAFARHYLRNNLFSSGYLDVSVPRVPRTVAMNLRPATQAFPCVGFPIRKSTDQSSSATPRSLSQRYTSFIGS